MGPLVKVAVEAAQKVFEADEFICSPGTSSISVVGRESSRWIQMTCVPLQWPLPILEAWYQCRLWDEEYCTHLSFTMDWPARRARQ